MTTYAQTLDGLTIETVAGRLPNAARRLDSRAWVLGFPQASPDVHAACGWYAVADVAQPSPDHVRSIELVDGLPVMVWTFDQARQDARLDSEDRDGKRATVGGAVATLRQWATDAAGTTVTTGNAVAVTQTMVNRLGVFFDRFADLIEAQRLDQ